MLVALAARELNLDEFKSGGLHEKHAVATWEPSQHLLKDRGKPRNPVSRWPAAGLSGCILTSSQRSGKQKYMGDSLIFPCLLACSVVPIDSGSQTFLYHGPLGVDCQPNMDHLPRHLFYSSTKM
jgi:hypothetical protein